MFVAAIVFVLLSTVSTALMMALLAVAVLLVVVTKGERVLDQQLRKLRGDEYEQLVALPLSAAIVGGLIATAIPVFVAYPPWSHDSSKTNVAYILVALALVVAVVAPLSIHALSADPKNLIIGLRIDRLKDGDWTHDSKADVLQTIDKQKSEIENKAHRGGNWFLLLLVVAVASDIGWPILDHVIDGVWPSAIAVLVLAAGVLCGLGARYWVRPISWRYMLTNLDAYRAEADRLSPPAPTAPQSSMREVHHYYHHYELRTAVGGFLAGAIIARMLANPTRRKQQI
jgi:hypothetical protein